MKRRRRRTRAGRGARLPEPVRRDVAAVAFAAAGALGLVALSAREPSGLLWALRAGLVALLGAVAPALPVLTLAFALALLLHWNPPAAAARWLGAAMGILVAAGFAQLPAGAGAPAGDGGGLAGWAVDGLLGAALGPAGTRVVLGAAAAAAAVLALQFPLRHVVLWPLGQALRAARALGQAVHRFLTGPERPSRAARPSRPARARRPAAPAPTPGPEETAAAAAERPEPEPPAGLPAPVAAEPPAEVPPAPEPEPVPANPAPRPIPLAPGILYQAPPLDLLRKGSRPRTARGRDTAQRAAVLEEALRNFGISARVVDVTQGPAVTRFEVQPGAGVKVSRIAALADDLALALCAPDVRIVAPIPGKAAVGIEVPNSDVTPVLLRDVMETAEFQGSSSPLTVCLGQDIAGKPVVASLETLLHVLVAGATGSGKSATLNCMLISLLYKASPEQLRLVLIDPKMVELSQYNGIPHLLAPVVTDPRKAAATLRVVVKEMERRYALFQAAGTRNIGGYNALARERGEGPLPFVVVVIDELADLMLVARAEVEDAIQRLTQMARAAGIHLIVATQRPSVDVVTGVVKANIPTRIALAVASQIDSRTILDGAGAEKLVGRGDMLFRPVGAQKAIRAQGAYVSEAEVEAVLEFLRRTGRPEYDAAIMEAEAEGDGQREEEEDDLFVRALQVVVESGQASVSNLQRRLRVGFTRAGRLIDMMEQRGFVGPHQGSKSREVLLTMEQFRRLYGERLQGMGPG
jgi:S-DNA-T family DNA segregation ATPase FtsK/SpoIIIE